MTGPNYTYVTNCISSTEKLIRDMCDQEKQIRWRTFVKHVPINEIRKIFPDYSYHGETYNDSGELTIGFHIKDDWAVQFYKSVYRDRPCYFIRHSGIEYIFQESQ